MLFLNLRPGERSFDSFDYSLRNICLLKRLFSRYIIILLLFYSLIFMIFCSSMRRSYSVAGVIDVTNLATPIEGLSDDILDSGSSSWCDDLF